MTYPWGIEQYGGVIHIDDYKHFPTETIASIDLETNGKEIGDPEFKIVCVGICGNGQDCYIYFDLRPQLFEYLRKVMFVAQDGKRAEVPWLAPYGITIDQLFFDTKIGAYVMDSARKNYSLKPLIKDIFGVEYPTYEEMISNKEMIDVACQESLLDDSPISLYLKDKKGNNKLPKELDLSKMPKEYVAAYNACDVYFQYKLWKWLEANFSVAQKNFFETIEMPLNRLLYHTERQGIKIDTVKIRELHKQFSQSRRKYKKEFFNQATPVMLSYLDTCILAEKDEKKKLLLEQRRNNFTSECNLNSPSQVLEVLQVNGLGVKGTSEGVLQRYNKNPIVASLLEYRGYQKLASTYTTPLYFNAIKDNNNHIYARFSQNTITGRLSSSDPINLQNQPPEVREAFISDPGTKFINADWSNIELRLPAHFSNEPKLVNEFLKEDGGDVHKVTAKLIFGPDVESRSDFKAKRAIAKTCNFLLTNSGTPSRLANELNVPEIEAEGLYLKFWEGYPILANWLKEEKRRARSNLGVTDWFGRWVSLPQLVLTCGNWNCAKSGKFCRQCFMREEAERSAMSILVQGTASSMCKLAALRLYKEYGYVPNLLVHDEINTQVADSQVEEARDRIKYVMENVVSLRIPLVAELGIGKNWALAKGK